MYFYLKKKDDRQVNAAKAERDASTERALTSIPPLLARKQKELLQVLKEKTRQVSNSDLNYLDYLELKEEIDRLRSLKRTLFAK